MREKTRRLRNKAENKSGIAFQIRRTLVSNRMMARTETTPVGAMRSPDTRAGSGLSSVDDQTISGARNAQIAMAMHRSAFPQSIAFIAARTPNRSTKICVKRSDKRVG